MNINQNHPWDDPDDGGVLDGPGFRGDYDGPEAALMPTGAPELKHGSYWVKLVPKLYVWDGNQHMEFELTLRELARLALPRFVPGRSFELPVRMKYRRSDAADCEPSLARTLLGRLLRSEFEQSGVRQRIAEAISFVAEKVRGARPQRELNEDPNFTGPPGAPRPWVPTGVPVDDTDAWIQGLYGMYKSQALKDDEIDEMLGMMSPPPDMAETLLEADVSELMQKMRERHPHFAADEGFMTWFENLVRGLKKRAEEVHGAAFPQDIQETVRGLHKIWSAGLSIEDAASQLFLEPSLPAELKQYTPDHVLAVATELHLAHRPGTQEFSAWLFELWDTLRDSLAARTKPQPPPVH